MFELTKQQEMLVKMVREFSEKEIAPRAEELDHTGQLSSEVIRKLTELDLMGLNVPKEYGGVGLGEVDKVLAVM